MKNVRLWSLALLGFCFAIGFGRWAQSLFTKNVCLDCVQVCSQQAIAYRPNVVPASR